MEFIISHFGESVWVRMLAIVFFALVAHLLVLLIRKLGQVIGSGKRLRHRKLRTVTTLVTSSLIFTVYFLALGMVLQEFNVSLTAYLASASVIGLAVGFGSQGFVQDVVMGLTFIFGDLIDVDDLVEISAQTGKVRAITLRFVELENAMGARVFIPNRTINNVINYPRGYVRLLADVTLSGDPAQRERMAEQARQVMDTVHDQFPGILLTPPSVEGQFDTRHGKTLLRLKFRIWPNRGQPIEQAVQKDLVARLQAIDQDYKDWMVTVTYEVEARTAHRGR